MKRYERYKSSGIDWVGEIPSHWEIKKFKHLYKSNMGATLLKTDLVIDGKIPVYSATESDVLFGYVDETNVLLEPGDLVIPARGNSIGHITMVNEVATCTQTTIYAKRISDSFNQRFLFQYLKGLREILFQFDRTAIPQITVGQIKENPVLLPPLSEQEVIAKFLDSKTANIDLLISEKQKLIDVLAEERTAIINTGITKGINDREKLKPTKNIWIGDIPEHWQIVKCNHYIRLRHGYQFMNYDFTSSGIKVVKITQLNPDGTLDLSSATYIDESRLQEFQDILINVGDILMALTGGTIGKIIRVTEVNEPLLQNYRVGKFFPANDKMNKDFMFWVLSSDIILNQIFFEQRETGQPNIGKENFNSMKIALPPLQEQVEIAKAIQKGVDKISEAISKIKIEIQLIQEYRAALISEVVTGKIKVN